MIKSYRSLTFYSWYILAALSIFAAYPVFAQPVRSPISADISAADIEGFVFPKSLGRLIRQSKVDYKSSGLGFSVTYAEPGKAWADIYIYDKQLDLPSGPALDFAKREVEAAVGDVNTAVQAGVYQKAKVLDRSESNSFAKARLRLTQGGNERDSFIFITVNRGKFVKIRMTAVADNSSNDTAETVLTEFERTLRKP